MQVAKLGVRSLKLVWLTFLSDNTCPALCVYLLIFRSARCCLHRIFHGQRDVNLFSTEMWLSPFSNLKAKNWKKSHWTQQPGFLKGNKKPQIMHRARCFGRWATGITSIPPEELETHRSGWSTSHSTKTKQPIDIIADNTRDKNWQWQCSWLWF